LHETPRKHKKQFLFILLPLVKAFVSFFLDEKRNKKIKANPNASGRFARLRHMTSLLYVNQQKRNTVFQDLLN
jgi:hypothetical protein